MRRQAPGRSEGLAEAGSMADVDLPPWWEAWAGSKEQDWRVYLDLVAAQPGERVLDVGCGAGGMCRLAAARVGASGYVAGVDPNHAALLRGAALPPLSEEAAATG